MLYEVITIAEASAVFPRRIDDVTISVVLDKNAQTQMRLVEAGFELV